jgi:D-alanyl-lipoteichoic acid acyltransferase DltB (MBOAT superfamily)
MLFDTAEFLAFALLFFPVHRLLRTQTTARLVFTVVASVFFYAWWDWRFAALLVGCVVGSHRIACVIDARRETPSARKFLALALGVNLTPLLVFKYLGFFTTALIQALALVDVHTSLTAPALPLPAGISFFSFHTMSYVVDVYRGHAKPAKSGLSALAFIGVFPQLVAGPITRASILLPQVERVPPKLTSEDAFVATKLLARGFFKKMVLADNIDPMVSLAFVPGAELSGSAYWWSIAFLFAAQLYCDFSGYSDIASGLAKLMGLDVAKNFDHPYLARGFGDFWSRWHISLSSWFRDYVYVPLGGGRKGTVRGHVNLWVTMLLSGLWHGANWTFLAWGGLNAAFASIERMPPLARLRKLSVVAIPWTIVVVVGWTVSLVFFRAVSIAQATTILGHMFSFTGSDLAAVPHPDEPMTSHWPVLLGIIVARHVGVAIADRWQIKVPRALEAIAIGVVIAACILFRGPSHQFIYFQF